MPKIRYYDDSELEGLTPAQLDHLRLVSRVLSCDEYKMADATQLEHMSDAELLGMLDDIAPRRAAPKPQAPPTPRAPRQSKKLAPAVKIKPQSLNDAFRLINGTLYKRHVARIEAARDADTRYTRDVEHFTVCGARVRFGDRIYNAAAVAQFLLTGDLTCPPKPRSTPRVRYKAQVRQGARVVHLGYFDTPHERDAAVLNYRLGLGFPLVHKPAVVSEDTYIEQVTP